MKNMSLACSERRSLMFRLGGFANSGCTFPQSVLATDREGGRTSPSFSLELLLMMACSHPPYLQEVADIRRQLELLKPRLLASAQDVPSSTSNRACHRDLRSWHTLTIMLAPSHSLSAARYRYASLEEVKTTHFLCYVQHAPQRSACCENVP